MLGAVLPPTVKINGDPLIPIVPTQPAMPIIPSPHNIPWWDISGQIQYAIDHSLDNIGNHLRDFITNQVLHPLGIATVHLIGVALPTIACLGILLWMCPFFPWHEKSPKVVGTSLFLYMFFVLLGGLDV